MPYCIWPGNVSLSCATSRTVWQFWPTGWLMASNKAISDLFPQPTKNSWRCYGFLVSIVAIGAAVITIPTRCLLFHNISIEIPVFNPEILNPINYVHCCVVLMFCWGHTISSSWLNHILQGYYPSVCHNASEVILKNMGTVCCNLTTSCWLATYSASSHQLNQQWLWLIWFHTTVLPTVILLLHIPYINSSLLGSFYETPIYIYSYTL